MAACNVCFRHCHIEEGDLGFCGARICRDGEVVCANYGRLTALALDPIEKKPLARFCPGSMILSVGSYGCNLRCPFCQNSEISWSDTAFSMAKGTGVHTMSPEELAAIADSCRKDGNIGVAFTYNEPLIGWEYVRDTAKLVHGLGMKNVLVTNGTAELTVLEELLPYIDAMNVDFKGFGGEYYRRTLGGSRQQVMDFIERAASDCHVEVTTLIVPGENDTEEEMREISGWIAQIKDGSGSVIGREIPLHISRFFPRFHMTDREATDVRWVYHLADIARGNLTYVLTGNC